MKGILPAVLLAVLVSCHPADQGGVPPVASFTVGHATAKTTDTVQFDASLTDPGDRSNKAYYRWDWNHDGIWDEEYSRLPVAGYRFFSKGTYNPVLEVLNSDGLTDTSSVQLIVNQGYSAPHPTFTITPEFGNFTTRFIFDASATRDDEDSIDQLRFSWDFAANGTYVTPPSPKTYASFVYPDTGRYTVILEVTDPLKMRTQLHKSVWVTNINPRLVADFGWTPVSGTSATVFTLDGSSSYSLDQPQAVFRYSWKLPANDYIWTEWTHKPQMDFQMKREASYDLELRIMDTAGLVNYCKKSITIYHQNLPPKAKYTIGCRRGNVRTQFYFNSWLTLDPESLPTTLEVRWDFDGDEKWDTEYTKDRIIYHNYPEPGTYKVYMEARDPDGLSDTTAQFVEVTSGTNETGVIYDQRDGQYYGSVKIGNQWWMSQNLNFSPYNELKDEVRKICYIRYLEDPVPWCDILGGLYNVYHATREDYYGTVRGICPWGWHMPSRKELETLIETIGGWNQADQLLPGGPTDFNALYAGCSEIVWDPIQRLYVEKPKWINYAAFFWSFNKMSNPYAPNSWSIALIKDEKKILPGWSGMDNKYSVRCVKNEE